MKKQKIMKKVSKIITKLAYKVAEVDANTTCAWLGYQSSLPKDVRKLRKF